MKIEILICTSVMLNDYSNSSIESTTLLSDSNFYQCIFVPTNSYVTFVGQCMHPHFTNLHWYSVYLSCSLALHCGR